MRWEYLRLQTEILDIKGSDAQLETLGGDGWEMTGVVHTGGYVHIWFRRPAK